MADVRIIDAPWGKVGVTNEAPQKTYAYADYVFSTYGESEPVGGPVNPIAPEPLAYDNFTQNLYTQSEPDYKFYNQNSAYAALVYGNSTPIPLKQVMSNLGYNTTKVTSVPAQYTTSGYNNRADQINAAFDFWSTPGLEFKANLLGQIVPRSRQEVASGYQDLWPDLYKSYVSGSINYNDLFRGALLTAASVDTNMLGSSSTLKYSSAPRVSFSFNSSGGGRYSWSGGGFSF